MNITVYCGSRPGSDPAYVEAAKELGAWIGKNGHTLVYGGGAVGMMGALADSVMEHGGKVIGVIPEFMVELEWLRDGLTETYIVDTMSERKAKFIELADAFIALPGGVGTLEEITEIICRVHLRLSKEPCILLDLNDFYAPLRGMVQKMIDEDYFEEDRFEEILFAESVREICEMLEANARKE